ncbi:MAG: DUF1326 domain-containing protein [Acidobacteriota bacterium]
MSNWWWKADYFETCNCAYGCPCNLNSIPTDGTCKAIDAWHIKEGAFGDVRLDGLSIALLCHWPNPIHEGNGTVVVYVDENANTAQRKALAEIGTGEAGAGGPFEVFASTCTAPPKVVYGPMTLERDGKRATMRCGEMGRADLAPIRSAMDGSEADVRMVMPGGFIWKDGQMVNTEFCEVNADGMSFRFENSSAYLSEVEYNV